MVPSEAGNLYLLSARESVRQALLGVDRVQAFLKAQRNDLRVGYSTYLNTKLLDVVRRIKPEGTGFISSDERERTDASSRDWSSSGRISRRVRNPTYLGA